LVEYPDRSQFVEPPPNLDTPTEVYQPTLFLPGFSTVAPLDIVESWDVRPSTAEPVVAPATALTHPSPTSMPPSTSLCLACRQIARGRH